MSFLLRATLAIGALSYLAATRDGAAPSADALVPRPEAVASGLAAAWAGLPAPVRERAAREGAAELSRRLAASPASGDTLAGADRLAPWRGAGGR